MGISHLRAVWGILVTVILLLVLAPAGCAEASGSPTAMAELDLTLRCSPVAHGKANRASAGVVITIVDRTSICFGPAVDVVL